MSVSAVGLRQRRAAVKAALREAVDEQGARMRQGAGHISHRQLAWLHLLLLA